MRMGLWSLLLQTSLVLAAPLVAFAPRRDGPHLLVPLAGGDAGRTAVQVAASGARMVSTGPLPGSVFLWGDGAKLAPLALARGAVVISAAPQGCSRPEEKE